MAKTQKQTDSGDLDSGPNPFPSSAVARLSPTAAELLTITTDAVRQATSYLDDYLKRGGAASPTTREAEAQGNVIAIVGEYGTGKTHIALELLHRITATDSAKLHPLYLDAPADTFLALYKERFIPKLERDDVRDRVEEYLADIVADELAKSQLTTEKARQLRSRDIAPLELIRTLGLMESEFMEQLHSQLRVVTERKDFGTAFSLFLRPEFEDAVWEWLQGNPPDEALRDRGIQRTIDSDPAVLETIGVLAFLYGRQSHRFVLVIDEMEKVLSHSTHRRPDEATILAFKKLMEAMGKTRALLIVAGLPDFLEVLPEDAQQRIPCIVRPTGLTPEDTAKYIREAQKRANGRERLKPFTRDTVTYVSEIAGGNARKVVRLCYHAFQAAERMGTDVTRAMLRETAREQFELTTTEDVSTEISRAIDLNGWLFESEKIFGEGETSTEVDFWISVGDKGAGCAVLISRSLLYESEVEDLAKRMNRLRAEQPLAVLGLLVVNGYLAENLSESVGNSFDRVIVFRARSFSDDIDAALKGAVRRIEESLREDNLVLIRDRIEQITRQTSATRSTLLEVSHQIPSARLIERSVEQGLRAVFGQLSGQSRETDPRFPRVTSEFDRAEVILDALRSAIDEAVDHIFPIERGHRRSRMRSLQRDLDELVADRAFFDYISSVSFLDRLVSRFRKLVFARLSRLGRRETESQHSELRELNRTCNNLDRSFHMLFSRSDFFWRVETPIHIAERLGIESRRVGSDDIHRLEQLPRAIFEAIKVDTQHTQSGML